MSTPSERSLAARLAAYTLHSRVDGAAHTAPARRALMEKFELEVDPQGILPPEERARRADLARKAYFTRLALMSAKSRRARRGQAA